MRTPRNTALVGFAAGALGLAWLGAYVDSFILQPDEVSARAIGTGGSAYPLVLNARLVIALIGCILFGAGLFFLRRRVMAVETTSAFGRSLMLGATYSIGFAVLNRIAMWQGGGGPFVILLWALAIGMPPVMVWLLGGVAGEPAKDDSRRPG